MEGAADCLSPVLDTPGLTPELVVVLSLEGKSSYVFWLMELRGVF